MTYLSSLEVLKVQCWFERLLPLGVGGGGGGGGGGMQSSKLAGSPKSEASEIMLRTSETILALVRSD